MKMKIEYGLVMLAALLWLAGFIYEPFGYVAIGAVIAAVLVDFYGRSEDLPELEELEGILKNKTD